ncbi:MAG: hypothetical protein ACLP9L_29290 [Thermoguttaceae bacterium]
MSEPQSDKSLLRGINAGTASGAAKLDREYRQKLHALTFRIPTRREWAGR